MATEQSYTTSGLDADARPELAGGQRRRAHRVQVKRFERFFDVDTVAAVNAFLETIPAEDVLAVQWQVSVVDRVMWDVCVVVYREWREMSR